MSGRQASSCLVHFRGHTPVGLIPADLENGLWPERPQGACWGPPHVEELDWGSLGLAASQGLVFLFDRDLGSPRADFHFQEDPFTRWSLIQLKQESSRLEGALGSAPQASLPHSQTRT